MLELYKPMQDCIGKYQHVCKTQPKWKWAQRSPITK